MSRQANLIRRALNMASEPVQAPAVTVTVPSMRYRNMKFAEDNYQAHFRRNDPAGWRKYERERTISAEKDGRVLPSRATASTPKGSVPSINTGPAPSEVRQMQQERQDQQRLFEMEVDSGNLNPERAAVQRKLEFYEKREASIGRNQSNIPLQIVQERIKQTKAATSESTMSSPSNMPVAGSQVGSTQAADIAGYNLDRNAMHTALTAGAGGLIGGVTSYATGGEFGQGAMAGTMGGLAIRGGGHILNSNKQLAGKMSEGLQSATSAFVDNNRAAMLAGGGLTGFVFGGKRESKKRGFNSSRGNGF